MNSNNRFRDAFPILLLDGLEEETSIRDSRCSFTHFLQFNLVLHGRRQFDSISSLSNYEIPAVNVFSIAIRTHDASKNFSRNRFR